MKTRIGLRVILAALLFFVPKAGAGKGNYLSYQSEKFCLKKITFDNSDSWFSRDKAHHFLTSVFLTSAGYYYCRELKKFSNFKSQQGAVCFSVSLGLSKEIRDGLRVNNDFSWKDLLADLVGTALGLALVSD